jgi:hypothetical protein
MACAKCAFYLPKDSTKAQLLEAKTNLLRLRQNIPLAEAELSAVEEGLTAYEQLLAKLADVPTPAGPTPGNSAGSISCKFRGENSQHDPTIRRSFAIFGDNLRSSDLEYLDYSSKGGPTNASKPATSCSGLAVIDSLAKLVL